LRHSLGQGHEEHRAPYLHLVGHDDRSPLLILSAPTRGVNLGCCNWLGLEAVLRNATVRQSSERGACDSIRSPPSQLVKLSLRWFRAREQIERRGKPGADYRLARRLATSRVLAQSYECGLTGPLESHKMRPTDR
jgi:hypothetical protein